MEKERAVFYLKDNTCIGCNACQMACKDKNHIEMGKFFRRADTVEVTDESGNKKWLHVSLGCRHCEDAACIKACRTGAMTALEDGTVVVDREKCAGCGQCVRACSYGAVFIDRDRKASKCDGCIEERKQGKNPACVDACLTHCLQFGKSEKVSEEPIYFRINRPGSKENCRNRNDVQRNELQIKNRNILEKLTICSDFFAEKEKACEILCRGELADSLKLDDSKNLGALYDNLFRGTDAFFTAKMWASVSRGEQILLNEITLEVIRFYHKYGYEPQWIEGNPPDYIGEQFAFLEYMFLTMESEKDIQEVQKFINQYTVPTMRELVQSVSGFETAEKESQFTDGAESDREEEILCVFVSALKDMEEFMMELAGCSNEDLSDLIKRENPIKRNPPIPDEKEHVINTAGLNNCGGICVIRPTVADNCMLKIESDCNQEHSPQIRACVRGRGYRKTFLNPARLKYPMKRVGKRGSGKFERISWEEATDIIAENWKRITEQYGPSSRYVLYGTGVEGIMRPGKMMKRLLSLDGGYLDYFNSYSSACVNYISKYMFGTASVGNSPADLLNTKLIILWADNTAESIFGPERNYYLSKCKEQGIRIIAIDPRMSQTAVTYADEWYAIKPSTDAALADAMAYVIWSEGLQDQHFMDTYCIGFDEEHMPEGIGKNESCHSYLFGKKDGIRKTPEWAEKITGIAADRIRKLARLYATTKPACISTGLGAQRHGNGEQSARGIMMLSCLTGNVGIAGGGCGGNISMISDRNVISNLSDRVKNPYPGEIPTFLWTKAIEHGREMTAKTDRVRGVDRLSSDIKMIFCLASDILINQHSNVNDTIRILEDESKCEFILCSDIFMTPSARYADLVLPATSVFEGENLAPSWAGGNYLVKNNQVIRPFFGCRFEWEWIKELAEKLGLYDAFVDGKPEVKQWLVENYELFREKEAELPDYETFSAMGGYQYKKQVCQIAFEEEIRNPKEHPFQTSSGKIEIFSKTLFDMKEKDVPGIPQYLPTSEGPEDGLKEKYPLQLIGWHTRRRCHSIHDNNEWMDEVEKPGIWINPADASSRGIENGDEVEVFNDRGCVKIPAVVTDRIREGVAAIAQGGWYTPDKNGKDVRGCINVLTSSKPTPLAKGNPQHTNLVEIKRA